MSSLKAAYRLIQLAIVLVAVALAYNYRDTVKEAYHHATGYVREVNKQLGIGLSSPPKAASPPAAPARQVAGAGGEAASTEATPVAAQPATPTEPSIPTAAERAPEPAPQPSQPQAPAQTADAAPEHREPAALGEAPAPPAPPQEVASEAPASPPLTPEPESVPPSRAVETAPPVAVAPAQMPQGGTAASEAPPAAPVGGAVAAATDSLPALLAKAREATRTGAWEQAERLYLGITQRYPEGYDAYGELGNLYYAHGQPREAARSYYQAAVRLLSAGYRREAEHLQQVLRPLDAGLAASLETKLVLARLKQR